MWFGEPHPFPETGSPTGPSASGQQSYEEAIVYTKYTNNNERYIPESLQIQQHRFQKLKYRKMQSIWLTRGGTYRYHRPVKALSYSTDHWAWINQAPQN